MFHDIGNFTDAYDRAPFLAVPGVAEGVAEELVKVSAKLDEFEGRLRTYMRDVGVPELSEDELKQLGLDVALDAAEWLADQTPQQFIARANP